MTKKAPLTEPFKVVLEKTSPETQELLSNLADVNPQLVQVILLAEILQALKELKTNTVQVFQAGKIRAVVIDQNAFQKPEHFDDLAHSLNASRVIIKKPGAEVAFIVDKP